MPRVPRRCVFTAVFTAFAFIGAIPIASADTSDDGDSLTGDSLNGRTFGIGMTFHGGEHLTLSDGTVVESWIRGGEIRAMPREHSIVIQAAAGMTLSVKDAIGTPLMIEIEGTERLAIGAVAYKFWRRGSADSIATKAICPDENGRPTYGMLLPNRWDERTGARISGGYTFTCPTGALYKCAVAGYNPWRPDRVELHQACTRVIRADYCGDGRSHTREGTPVYFGGDDHGIHSLTLRRGQVFEAAWTAEGATCMGIAKTNASPFILVKRWRDLWRRHLCLLPFCPPDVLTARPSVDFLLMSACEPTAEEADLCAGLQDSR